MANVNVNGKDYEFPQGETLYRALRAAGLCPDAPCGGQGTCGKCGVEVEGRGVVLACRQLVEDGLRVRVDSRRGEIVTGGYLREVEADTPGTLAAVDIGTTTVAAYLIRDGRVADVESALNAQRPYGGDVISRIRHTMDHPNGTQELSALINSQVDGLLQALYARQRAVAESVAVVGNTVMLHLFAGVSPASLGVAPFTRAFTGEKRVKEKILLPTVAAYVGADTLAAILASGMHLDRGKSLLLDIGTNGEIALGRKSGILTCAAAAGPAFEGANISCGTGGVAGAIDAVTIRDGRVSYTTIGGGEPVGVCGSGILDAVAAMLQAGLIDETGYFEEEEWEIAPGIAITARDIREVQLAKAAIAAGIRTLLEESGTRLADIDTCYLAGGFGSRLHPRSAVAIGLIPPGLEHKIVSLGNAAAMGAVLYQISSACRKELADIVNLCDYVELSNSKTFNEHFVNCMYF